MKKLLKFGIVSLSLTTLGVVGQLTELPVFGTQVVRAEDSVAETIRVIKYYQDSETGKHVIPATVVEVPKSETYSVTADSIDGHTPVRYSVLAFGFQWSAEGDGAIANFNHAEAIPDGDDSVIVSFYYTKNQTPPVETPEGEGGGEVETPPIEEQKAPKAITVERVAKTADGTVLETSTMELTLDKASFDGRYSFIANHIEGYRLSGYTRQEVSYDEVQDGDKVVLEAIYKAVDPNNLDADALTVSIEPIDTNLKPLPLEPKTVTIYPGENFFPTAENSPVYPGYEFRGYIVATTYDKVKNLIAQNGSNSLPIIYSPVQSSPAEEPVDGDGTQTPPVETPEGEGGGETQTPPVDTSEGEGGGDTQTPPVAKSVMVTLTHKLIGVSQDSGDRVLYSEDVPLYENGSIFVEPKTFPGVVPTTEPFSLSYDEVVSSGIYYTHINYRPADKPVDGGKEIYTNTTNEPIGVAVYYVGENLDGTRVKLLDSDLIITVNPGEEVSALRDFDGYTLDSTSYIPPFFSEGILTYSYKQDTPPADNPGDSDGGETQTPPTDKPVDGDKTETPVPTPTPETPEERQARINHNLRVLRSEVERVERALTYPKLTPAEVAALEAFKAKRLETIASLEQTGELGDDNLTEADIKAFDTVLALELSGVFNDKDAEQPISTPAPKDLAADRNKLLLSVDESGLTAEQKSKLAEKIAFAETEKDLADLKAELVKLVKAAEKPTDKPAKEAPKAEVKAPAAAAKPAANAPAKSDKAALPATGDGARVGLIAAGFSLLLLGLGLAKSRKHN